MNKSHSVCLVIITTLAIHKKRNLFTDMPLICFIQVKYILHLLPAVYYIIVERDIFIYSNFRKH